MLYIDSLIKKLEESKRKKYDEGGGVTTSQKIVYDPQTLQGQIVSPDGSTRDITPQEVYKYLPKQEQSNFESLANSLGVQLDIPQTSNTFNQSEQDLFNKDAIISGIKPKKLPENNPIFDKDYFSKIPNNFVEKPRQTFYGFQRQTPYQQDKDFLEKDNEGNFTNIPITQTETPLEDFDLTAILKEGNRGSSYGMFGENVLNLAQGQPNFDLTTTPTTLEDFNLKKEGNLRQQEFKDPLEQYNKDLAQANPQAKKTLAEMIAERSGDSNLALSGMLLAQQGFAPKALGTLGFLGGAADMFQQGFAGYADEISKQRARQEAIANQRERNPANIAGSQPRSKGYAKYGGNVKTSLWETIQSKRQGTQIMQEGGDVTGAIVKNEITQEINPLQLQQQPQAPTKEIEVEKGEYIKDPYNNIAKVEDKSENGHDKGGVRIQAEGGTRVLSNFLKLDSFNKKELKALAERLSEITGKKITPNSKNTYADVMDKAMKSLGVNEKREEQEKLAKELEKADIENSSRDKDIKTKEMNTLLVGKKMQELEEEVSATQEQQEAIFDELYNAQESSKEEEIDYDEEFYDPEEQMLYTEEADIPIYQEGGEYYTDREFLPYFQNWANNNGFTSFEQVNDYFKNGGCLEFKEGGELSAGGHKFSGYNKPIATPNHKTKSHAVLAKEGDKVKLIRFGQQGVKGAGKNPKSEKDKARRKSYYARHNAQGKPASKFSAKYWSHKVKW
jgi:hypothetical protein